MHIQQWRCQGIEAAQRTQEASEQHAGRQLSLPGLQQVVLTLRSLLCSSRLRPGLRQGQSLQGQTRQAAHAQRGHAALRQRAQSAQRAVGLQRQRRCPAGAGMVQEVQQQQRWLQGGQPGHVLLRHEG